MGSVPLAATTTTPAALSAIVKKKKKATLERLQTSKCAGKSAQNPVLMVHCG
jgi:hypothetical protein